MIGMSLGAIVLLENGELGDMPYRHGADRIGYRRVGWEVGGVCTAGDRAEYRRQGGSGGYESGPGGPSKVPLMRQMVRHGGAWGPFIGATNAAQRWCVMSRGLGAIPRRH